jgi:type VI secretion system protein VasI
MLLLVSSSFAAIDDKEYAKCAVIEGDLSRLECFDRLAKSKKLDGQQPQSTDTAGTGKWKISVEINPIDDTKSVYLRLISDSGKSRFGKDIYLIARCQSKQTELYIVWNSYLGSDVEVLSRIGNDKAIMQRWALSSDKQASFNSQPISFLKGMLTSPKLVVQVTPYNESPITAVFDTSGLESAIKPLRETCKW